MNEGPDLSRVATLAGDPACARMLSVLMGGMALTASELAREAGVGLPTASSHLARLSQGGLVRVASEGRHRYFALAGPEVAAMLEPIAGIAAAHGPRRVRPGPRDGTMRKARVCYDHLAGEKGVALFDHLLRRGFVRHEGEAVALTPGGRRWFEELGVDVAALGGSRRPLCRTCLDWSMRRPHLAGTLGAATLEAILRHGWARRAAGSRVLAFTPVGERAFARLVEGEGAYCSSASVPSSTE